MNLLNKLPDDIIKQIFYFNINPICNLVKNKLKTDIVAFTYVQHKQNTFGETQTIKRETIINNYVDTINKMLSTAVDIPTNIDDQVESDWRCNCFNCKNIYKRICDNNDEHQNDKIDLYRNNQAKTIEEFTLNLFNPNFVYIDKQPPTFMEIHTCRDRTSFDIYVKSSKYYKKRNIEIKRKKIVVNDYRDIYMMYSDIVNDGAVGDHDWNCGYVKFYGLDGIVKPYKAFEYDEFLVVFRNVEAGSFYLDY